MAIQTVRVSLDHIDDPNGLSSVETALKNINGVTGIALEPAQNSAVVSFDDTQTSIYAFNAAITMVDYVTQPFPEDAPANPHNDR